MRKITKVFPMVFAVAVMFLLVTNESQAQTRFDVSSSAAGSGISSARVYMPAGSGAVGAATVSGGFTNRKEQFYWLAERLQRGGVIAMAISASTNSSISGYESAHRAGVDYLNAQNRTSRSALNGRVRSIGIMGFSMGGGAVINQGTYSNVSAVVAMAPYRPNTPSRNHSAATMIITGTSDSTAPARMGKGAYDRLPSTTPRLYASMSGWSHMRWMNNSSPGSAATFIVAWAQYYLNGNQNAYNTFSRGGGSGMTGYSFNAGR